jgi:hypothetical protein
MIGKLMNGEANDVLVIALSGTVAVLVAKGPGRASLGRVLSGVLSNPIPGRVLSPTAAERRTAA